jgi:cytoskeleton protein RodZ
MARIVETVDEADRSDGAVAQTSPASAAGAEEAAQDSTANAASGEPMHTSTAIARSKDPEPGDDGAGEASTQTDTRARDAGEQAATAGEALRRRRLAMGLSLDDVFKATGIRVDYLQALEVMNFKAIPGAGYVPGFLRTYARVLKLDEATVLERFRQESTVLFEAPRAISTKQPVKPLGARMAPHAALITILLGAGLWFGVRAVMHPAAVQRNADTEWTDLNRPGVAAPAARIESEVAVRALRDARLEARGADGSIYLDRKLRKGEVYYPHAGEGWTLYVDAGQGDAFEVYIDGHPLGLLAQPGVDLQGWRIDEAVAQARASRAEGEQAVAGAASSASTATN